MNSFGESVLMLFVAHFQSLRSLEARSSNLYQPNHKWRTLHALLTEQRSNVFHFVFIPKSITKRKQLLSANELWHFQRMELLKDHVIFYGIQTQFGIKFDTTFWFRPHHIFLPSLILSLTIFPSHLFVSILCWLSVCLSSTPTSTCAPHSDL